MWQRDKKVQIDELNGPIYEALKRIAKQGGITTYSEIAPLAALDMEIPADRDEIRKVLGKISTYEYEK